MSDKELLRNIAVMEKLIGAAIKEAKYTGDFSYQKQLRKYYNAFTKENSSRMEAKGLGDKIVKKPGRI